MTAPSWYGEPMPDMPACAVDYVTDCGGRVVQSELLTFLPRGFDTRYSSARTWAQQAMDAGRLAMEWDSAGYPYYVAV